MPELLQLDPLADDAPLRDVRVVEIEGELSGYAGRLLADLGATVERVRFGAPAAALVDDRFMHSGKVERFVDLASPSGGAELRDLICATDIVVHSGGADAPTIDELTPGAVRKCNPAAIHMLLTPFGLDGPAAACSSSDLVRLAAGGLLWLGGYPDAEPVAAYGDQSTLATALFGVVGSMLALIERDRTGVGCTVEVSAQEVLTQALETALPEFELTGKVQRRVGDAPREAGTGIFPCGDGFVSMVAGRLGTAQAWGRLREWLVESGTPGAAELWGEEWESLSFRQKPESVERFSEIFGSFAAAWSKSELYTEAQRRGIALAPVNTAAEVLADPQLAARGFFRNVVGDDGSATTMPSPPYRFSAVRRADKVTLAPDTAVRSAAS
jgi:benzylsuccinate CoA-transferase BbsE subunit